MPGAFLVSESQFASQLYWSELTALGIDRLIGTVHTSSGTALAVTDIALAPDGALFAVTESQLFSVDRESAVASPVGSGLPDRTNALGFDVAGRLYAASAATGAFYRVDRVTGSITLITYGSILVSSGDPVFAPNRALLTTVKRTQDPFDTLVAIDPDNGVPTVVRTNLPDKMHGLCAADGFVYGAAASDNGLYLINYRNGVYKRIRTSAFPPAGA